MIFEKRKSVLDNWNVILEHFEGVFMLFNKKTAIVGSSLGLLFCSGLFAATITLNPNSTKQEIIGFGGGSVYYQGWITALGSDKQQALYDTAFTGLNLSFLRLGNWLQDLNKDLKDDSIIVSEAKARLGDHLKIEMSSWSAPAELKPSHSVNGSDANGDSLQATLKTSTTDKYGNYVYGDFAHWWKVSLERYQKAKIHVDYISFQNEPDMFASYEETLFAPTETSRRAGYAQALNAVYDSVKSIANAPKIIGPEPLGIGYNNFQNYMNKLDAGKLDGYAYHLYHAGNGNDNSSNNYANPENFSSAMSSIAASYADKPIIMTEFCTMRDHELESDMVGLAHIMQVGFTKGNLAAYIAWELFWGEGRGQMLGVCTKNWGSCTKDTIVVAPEYHAMRHYSKFVNPGSRVILSETAESALKTVAFKSASGDSISLVAINTGNTEIELNDFAVSGYAVIQAVQSVENGDKSKEIAVATNYKLPARSVTTLVLKTTSDANILQPSIAKQMAVSVSGRILRVDNVSAQKPFAVTDMQGRVLKKGVTAGTSFEVNLSHAGMYILKVGNATQTFRIQ